MRTWRTIRNLIGDPMEIDGCDFEVMVETEITAPAELPARPAAAAPVCRRLGDLFRMAGWYAIRTFRPGWLVSLIRNQPGGANAVLGSDLEKQAHVTKPQRTSTNCRSRFASCRAPVKESAVIPSSCRRSLNASVNHFKLSFLVLSWLFGRHPIDGRISVDRRKVTSTATNTTGISHVL